MYNKSLKRYEVQNLHQYLKSLFFIPNCFGSRLDHLPANPDENLPVLWNLNESSCSDSNEETDEKVTNPDNPGHMENPVGTAVESLEDQCRFYKLTSAPLRPGSRFV